MIAAIRDGLLLAVLFSALLGALHVATAIAGWHL